MICDGKTMGFGICEKYRFFKMFASGRQAENSAGFVPVVFYDGNYMRRERMGGCF